MRKILDQNFLSHGTLLGSLGSLFSKPLPIRFRPIYFLVVLRVLKLPLVAALMVDFLFTGLHWGHLWARLAEELVVRGVGVDRVDVLLQPPGKLELARALSAHERLGVFGVLVTR